jgi:glycosyltransferase involved in cell wall biosynthesis
MRILFITIAFAPNEFSESIVNSKLVLAFRNQGYYVDVISRGKHGVTYSSEWNEPWLALKDNTHQVEYEMGSRFSRLLDNLRSSLQFMYPLEGIRWIRRAFMHAESLIQQNKYDIIITRSPSDIPHIVGLKLKKKYRIPWIANWNDPSNGIMPEPYKNHPDKFANFISKYYTQRVLKVADFNTFPSERLRSYFSSFYQFPLKTSEVIPHIGMYLTGSGEKLTSNNMLSICHAGSLSIERNPDLLLKNIARIKKETNQSNIRLTIIGIADEQLITLIDQYGLREEVLFEASMPYIDTLRFMQQFDVLCIIEAKMKEGIFLPSKLSDYIFLNKPVFSYSPPIGTLTDLIDRYGGGIAVDNENNECVYDGLNKLIQYKNKQVFNQEFDATRLGSYLSQDSVLSKFESIFKALGCTSGNIISSNN